MILPVFILELLFETPQLGRLELADADAPPSLRGPEHGKDMNTGRSANAVPAARARRRSSADSRSSGWVVWMTRG